MSAPPLAALKWSLALVASALLLATSGVLWSWGQTHSATAAHTRAEATRAAAEARLGRGREQQELIAAHLADYEALAVRGFIGAEDRLGWIEAVQLAGRAAGLPSLEYRLDPRADTPATLAQGLPLKQTGMILTVPLLIEPDLARFLAALERHAPGVHRVHGCALTRTDSTPFEAVNQPRLKAECAVRWYTITLPAGDAA